MNLEQKVDALLAAVNDPTNGLAAIRTAITEIPASQPVDLSGVNAKLDTISLRVTDIQSQIDEPSDAAPAPAPAPSPEPAPAPASA